jgi:hypothetical protein
MREIGDIQTHMANQTARQIDGNNNKFSALLQVTEQVDLEVPYSGGPGFESTSKQQLS